MRRDTAEHRSGREEHELCLRIERLERAGVRGHGRCGKIEGCAHWLLGSRIAATAERERARLLGRIIRRGRIVAGRMVRFIVLVARSVVPHG